MNKSCCLVLALILCLSELAESRHVEPRVRRRSQMSSYEKLSDTSSKFELFKREFNRSYSSPLEEYKRLNTFGFALDEIEVLNWLEEGTAVYGVTEMADWTAKEFALRANLKREQVARLEAMPEVNLVERENVQIPTEFDWRTKNAVTAVKDQGRCGSCWAFVTVAMIENHFAIKHGILRNLSEQQLVDCDTKSKGCDGGWMDWAVESIMKKGGLNKADSYPYTGRQGACRFRYSAVGAEVTKNQRLSSNDESGHAQYIATTSSTMNAINARMLQYYQKGIISAVPSRCNNRRDAVNHAVNIVGYGREQGLDYWIGKNSWGNKWGERGFFRIQRGANTCGVANYVTAAIVK